MGCLKDILTGFASFILFFFNFLILTAACILLALAITIKLDNGGLDVMSITNSTIVVGAIVALVAFFGCTGALYRESRMLLIYAIICIIVSVVQLVLGITTIYLARRNNNHFKEMIRGKLDEAYGNHTTEQQMEAVAKLQQTMKCCGRMDDDPLMKKERGLVSSCCPSNVDVCTIDSAYKDSCSTKFINAIVSMGQGIGTTCFVYSVVEMVAAALAWYIRKTEKHEDQS